MKQIIALVFIIAIASAQIKSMDGTCDTNKWSDYTDADCTNELIVGFMAFAILAVAE